MTNFTITKPYYALLSDDRDDEAQELLNDIYGSVIASISRDTSGDTFYYSDGDAARARNIGNALIVFTNGTAVVFQGDTTGCCSYADIATHRLSVKHREDAVADIVVEKISDTKFHWLFRNENGDEILRLVEDYLYDEAHDCYESRIGARLLRVGSVV